MDRTPLFITGVGRSGTTALAYTLAGHAAIVAGIERYKRISTRERAHRWAPRHFDKDYFFDFSTGLTNFTPDSDPVLAAHYARMAEKFDTCRYLADKAEMGGAPVLLERFPDAKFVFIVRDPEAMAASWERRARDADDLMWPAENGAHVAVERWNAANAFCLDLLDRTRDVVLPIRYEAIFADADDVAPERIMRFLGLDSDEAYRKAVAQARATYSAVIAAKDRKVDPDTAAFIRAHADRRAYTALFPEAT